MKRNNEEHLIQCGIIDWYDIRYGDGMLLAIPNGGARDARTGAMLKREGVRAGVWDLLLAKPGLPGRPVSHGLWIEVKSPERRNHKRGGLTVEQWRFGVIASQNGYRCKVVYTTQRGIDVISRYLMS
jgi:hypothetical protein